MKRVFQFFAIIVLYVLFVPVAIIVGAAEELKPLTKDAARALKGIVHG